MSRLIKNTRYMFAGVGGMGMAPLACWLASGGHAVYGYDDYLQAGVRKMLEDAEVNLRDFVFEEDLSEFDVFVYSNALQPSHPLLKAAKAEGLRVLRRGELLSELAIGRRLIAVVGSHGKTTTAGLIAHGLLQNKLSGDYIIGGLYNEDVYKPYRNTGDAWLIAEVDESDGTIDKFAPEITLVLNLDWDHADYYADEAALGSAFQALFERTSGRVLLPENFPEALVITTRAKVERWHLEDSKTRKTRATDKINTANAYAAHAVLGHLGIKTTALDLFERFPGMARRQSCLHRDVLLTIWEDYAHHPTEVEALLACLRLAEPEKRLVVVFQAHRYSRTRQFKDGLAKALSGADEVFLLPIYGAHESEPTGGEMINLTMAFGTNAPKVLPMDAIGVERLAMSLGDTPTNIAFVGAGNVHHFASAFTAQVRSGFVNADAWKLYLAPRISSSCQLKTDEILASKTTMRVGGTVAFYAEPANLSDLHSLLVAAQLFEQEIFILGRGSNIIVPDRGYKGLVIRLNIGLWRESRILKNGRIWVGAGVRLKEVCGLAAKAGLAGFEFLEGIPGSVGGSLRMNAGAMGSWIFDVVERVQFMDADGQQKDMPQSAFHFGYRKVEEISQGIALGAILKSPEASDRDAIREQMDSYAAVRKASQPREPSAGCIFKNPEGNYAGKLIDEMGLKGERVGAAEVSRVHGNFIVNLGGATAQDIIVLIAKVRAAVYAGTGYLLEPEVLLLGQDWDTVLKDGAKAIETKGAQ